MKYSMAVAMVVCAVTLTPPTRADEAGQPDPQGAVLCVWMISSSLLHFGETCRPEQDRQYLFALRRNVERMEAFIFRTSDIISEQLDAYNRRRPSMRGKQCEPDGEMIAFHEAARSRGIHLDNETDKLLKVERPPVWNPCL